MAEQWEIEEAGRLLHMARYLFTKADQRGKTHGEKHYFIQTGLALLSDANAMLNTNAGRGQWTNEVTRVEKDEVPSDIPF